ncbi:Ribosome maturation factor RimM [Anaerolineae bacterium]|nr:Ribosome maturation factor RimM [Anaerolineae bacterium]
MADWVIVGEVAGAFGVKGWLKVHSHTEPPSNILNYGPWRLESKESTKECKILSGHMHGVTVVAQLEGVDDRDQALELRSSKILVPRDRFPPPEPGHYYWADLIGLRVENLVGIDFGEVSEILSTGANDVIVAKGEERERLIPFIIGQFVKEVDFEKRTMQVDWDADF